MQEAILKVQNLGVPPEGFEGDSFPGDEEFPDEDTSGMTGLKRLIP